MNKLSSVVIGIIAIIALIVGFSAIKHNNSVSVADKVIDSGEIRIGYIVYPPLLFKDQATGKLSGVSYDLVEATAKKLNLKTNWVEEVGWGSAIEGLKTKRYDILGTQMWPNSARAREAVFSIAPMNSVLYPYVKTGDTRFSGNLSKLNSNQYSISALDGEMAQFIAKDDYPLAKLNALPQTTSYAEVFLNIINGKADATFVEPSAANDFLKSNPGKIERVGNTPVRTFGNSFAFVRGQESMVSMWNVALGELINDGTVTRTLEKYNVAGDYTLNK
jgi:ABC-type amino acid transport substrate-binding protein